MKVNNKQLLYISSAAMFALTNQGLACEFCTPFITMNPQRAECFQVQYSELSDQVAKTDAGFVVARIDGCTIDKSGKLALGVAENEKRGVQDGMDTPQEVDLQAINSTLILDNASLTCLSKLIELNKDNLFPEIVFDMKRECS